MPWTLDVSLEYSATVNNADSTSLWYLLRNLACYDYDRKGWQMFLLGSGAPSERDALHASQNRRGGRTSSRGGKGRATTSNQLPLLYKPDVLAMIRTFVVDPKASVMGPEMVEDTEAEDTSGLGIEDIKLICASIAAARKRGLGQFTKEYLPTRKLTALEAKYHFNEMYLADACVPHQDVPCVYPWDPESCLATIFNPDLLADAFVLAADKVLGLGHGLSMRFMVISGEADSKASSGEMIIAHVPSRVAPRMDKVDRFFGGDDGDDDDDDDATRFNVPIGVQLTKVQGNGWWGVIELSTSLRVFWISF